LYVSDVYQQEMLLLYVSDDYQQEMLLLNVSDDYQQAMLPIQSGQLAGCLQEVDIRAYCIIAGIGLEHLLIRRDDA
jgi:hypothetical protein